MNVSYSTKTRVTDEREEEEDALAMYLLNLQQNEIEQDSHSHLASSSPSKRKEPRHPLLLHLPPKHTQLITHLTLSSKSKPPHPPPSSKNQNPKKQKNKKLRPRASNRTEHSVEPLHLTSPTFHRMALRKPPSCRCDHRRSFTLQRPLSRCDLSRCDRNEIGGAI